MLRRLVLLSLAIVLSGCQKTSESVELVAMLPTSGPLSFLGEPGRRALEIAQREVNDSEEKLAGRPLELRVIDTEGSPSVAALRASDIRDDAILLTTLSGVSLEIAKQNVGTDRLQFVVAIHPTIVTDYANSSPRALITRLCYNAKDEAKLISDAALEANPDRIAALVSVDAVSTAEYEQFIEPRMISGGVEDSAILYENFEVGEPDFRSLARSVSRFDPDVVILLGYGSDFPGLLEALYEYRNLSSNQTKIVGGIGFIELPSEFNRENYDNVVFTTPAFLLEDLSKEFEQFNTRYSEISGQSDDTLPPYDAVYTYDSVMLLKQAITELGTDATNEQLYKYIEGLEYYEGIGGRIEMRSSDGHPRLSLARFDANGNFAKARK